MNVDLYMSRVVECIESQRLSFRETLLVASAISPYFSWRTFSAGGPLLWGTAANGMTVVGSYAIVGGNVAY
ncbi:hypothetical protein BDZ45DRAFT_738908 [Acephala macrosclerotiorum]|nr:hypothetical protein BDZ45DRAFT_738908 [Acephala macrosclerotiorum]